MEFVCAAGAGTLAITLMYPVDMFKAYVQFNDQFERIKSSKWLLWRNMLRTNGVRAFYRGIQFVWLRQLVSSPLRYGGFEFLNNHYNAERRFSRKVAYAVTAGVASAAVATPFDVAVVQNQKANVDGSRVRLRVLMPPREYSYFFVPNALRATAFSCTSMLMYNVLSERVGSSFWAALLPSLAATVVGYPFDLVRSRMLQTVYAARTYTSFVDCVTKIVRTEGLGNLYNGYAVFAARDVPQTFILLYALDMLKRLLIRPKPQPRALVN